MILLQFPCFAWELFVFTKTIFRHLANLTLTFWDVLVYNGTNHRQILLSQGVRWVYLIFPLIPNMTFLYMVWPVGWTLSSFTMLFFYFPEIKRLKQKYPEAI